MPQRLSAVALVASTRWRGIVVCITVALAASFLSHQHGGPLFLYALLLGLASSFLYESPAVAPGVDVCARALLRLGVSLLGARLTLAHAQTLGWKMALVLVLAVASTVLLGALLARRCGRPASLGLLSGGAVGICGASAAMAIAAALPRTKESETWTLLVVIGVTAMSTLAMLIYPLALHLIGATPQQSGIVLGGSIHDVAQVVAAALLISPEAADTATLVKLFRVMLLLPVVLVIGAIYRRANAGGVRRAALPGFLIAFVALMLVNSAGLLPGQAVQAMTDLSRWCLLIAISATGLKSALSDLRKLGWAPIMMLVTETAWIFLFVTLAVIALGFGTQAA